jgi:hypothetical protein
MVMLRLVRVRRSLNSAPEVHCALLFLDLMGYLVKLADISVARANPEIVVVARFGPRFRFLLVTVIMYVAFRIRGRRRMLVIMPPRERMNQHVRKLGESEDKT